MKTEGSGTMATVFHVRFNGPKPGIVGKHVSGPGSNGGKLPIPKEKDSTVEVADAPGRTMTDTYSLKEVSRLFAISESRLRYWDRSGFINPSGQNGRRRCYTFQDLVSVRSAKTLLENGLSLQRARRIVDKLRDEIPRSVHPLGKLRILSDAKTVVVMDAEREYEAESGQLLLDFDVESIEQQIISKLPKNAKKKGLTAYEWYLEGCRLDENEATYAQAEEAYHRAIHMDPTLANAYTNLGNLLYRSGSLMDAKTLYEKAVEVDPDQPEAHYNLGFLDYEEGRLESAGEHFSRAVELDPTFADAHFNVAITLLKLGRTEVARNHLKTYLNLDPSGAWADVARKRLLELD